MSALITRVFGQVMAAGADVDQPKFVSWGGEISAAVSRLDSTVLENVTNSAPGSPVLGMAYANGSTINVWQLNAVGTPAWASYTVSVGALYWSVADLKLVYWDGAAWAALYRVPATWTASTGAYTPNFKLNDVSLINMNQTSLTINNPVTNGNEWHTFVFFKTLASHTMTFGSNYKNPAATVQNLGTVANRYTIANIKAASTTQILFETFIKDIA